MLFFLHASPISGIKIAALILLAQHKGHERIGSETEISSIQDGSPLNKT
jgi:hypothetical protein